MMDEDEWLVEAIYSINFVAVLASDEADDQA
jgi:hypothetical protein